MATIETIGTITPVASVATIKFRLIVGAKHYDDYPSLYYSYSCKNNNYSRSDNIKHCGADNTYCFGAKISNIVNQKSGDNPDAWGISTYVL